MLNEEGIALGDVVIQEVAARQIGRLLLIRFPLESDQISLALNAAVQPR